MFCPNCGKKLPEGSAFCGMCGTSLRDAQTPPGSGGSGRGGGTGGGGKRKIFRILLIAAAAAVVFAAAAFLLISGRIPVSAPGGGQADSDGMITVTFDCGVDDSADSGAGVSDEESADSEADVLAEVRRAPDAQGVSYGDAASCPAHPLRTGYVFGGWYTDEACTQAYDFSSGVTEELTLYARWLDPDSEEAQITEEDCGIYLDCLEKISDVYEAYTGDSGYVSEDSREQLMADVAAVAEECRQAGSITYFNVEDNTIYMEFASGLTYQFYIPEEGCDSDPMEMNAVIFLPFYGMDWAYDGGSDEIDEQEDAMVSLVENFALTDAAYGNVSCLSGFSYARDSSVVIWHGHGGYDTDEGSIMATSDQICSDAADLEAQLRTTIAGSTDTLAFAYQDGSVTGAGIRSGEEVIGIYAITSNYIRNYFPQLDDAIVYLATCQSGHDKQLADAFLSIGAQVVVANAGTDDIDTEYNQMMAKELFSVMSGQDSEEPYIHTAREALDLLSLRGYTNSFYEDKKGNRVYQNTYPDLFYADGSDAWDYTLWSGLEGSIMIDPSLELDLTELTVGVVNDITEATVDTAVPAGDGSFAIERMNGGEEYTYTLYVQKGDTVLLTVEDIEAPAHRIMDLGTLSVEAAQLDVCVRNEDGEILEDVSASVTGSDGIPHELTPGTDSAGSVIYQATVLPGEYTLSLSADGCADLTDTVMITGELTRREYTLETLDWASIYLKLLEDVIVTKDGDILHEELYEYDGDGSYEGFGLIYVNEDGIPELVVYGSFEATGNLILTIGEDGSTDLIRTRRLGFVYEEKRNVLDNCGGHMGYYYDILYNIENGKWVHLAEGERFGNFNEDDEWYYYGHSWHGADVSEAEYEALLAEYIDLDNSVSPPYDSIMTLDELKTRLKAE